MYAKTLFTAAATAFSAAILVLSAAPAQAQEVEFSLPTMHMSTLSRAEVRQAAISARAAGLIDDREVQARAQPFMSTKTRAQVRAETLEAIRLGALDNHEQSRPLTPMQLQSIEMAGLKALGMVVATR